MKSGGSRRQSWRLDNGGIDASVIAEFGENQGMRLPKIEFTIESRLRRDRYESLWHILEESMVHNGRHDCLERVSTTLLLRYSRCFL